MALAARVQSDAPKRKPSGLPCSVQTLLDVLPPDESAALQFMLDDGWSQERIYGELKAEGHEVGKQTLNRHRSKACRCFL
jgi:hypothetical protein